MNTLIILAIVFVLLGLFFLLLTLSGFKKRKFMVSGRNFILTLLMLTLSALFATISISIQGYQALTREELAAVVKIEPTGEQQFIARFILPEGTEKAFELSGDQLYVDAHILKWKPIANILGLHTLYELDRVSGRYIKLNDEKTKPRTQFSLSDNLLINMFDLRRKYLFLSPLVDAEYGSASFVDTDQSQEFRIMVSTTGLLIRKSGGSSTGK